MNPGIPKTATQQEGLGLSAVASFTVSVTPSPPLLHVRRNNKCQTALLLTWSSSVRYGSRVYAEKWKDGISSATCNWLMITEMQMLLKPCWSLSLLKSQSQRCITWQNMRRFRVSIAAVRAGGTNENQPSSCAVGSLAHSVCVCVWVCVWVDGCVCVWVCVHVTFHSITISHLENLFAGNLNEEVEY